MRKDQTEYEIVVNEKIIFKKSFLVAAIGFLIICAIGFTLYYTIDYYFNLDRKLKDVEEFQFNMYKEISKSNKLGTLSKISIVAIGLILTSSIFNVIWSTRTTNVSNFFMFLSFYIYLLAQGLGFGTLCIIWKAKNLIAIFGISGGILLITALTGYLFKGLLQLNKLLTLGWLFAWIFMVVILILFFTNIYKNTFYIITYSTTAFLTVGWTSYQVWSIRKTKEFKNNLNKVEKRTRFQLKMWWGFRILSDFILILSVFGYLIRKMITEKF